MMTSITKRRANFILMFTVSFTICLLMTAAYVHNKSQLEYTQMEQLAMVHTNKVSSVLNKLLYKTQVLSALVIQNDGQIGDFERVAATVLDDPSIRNVLLAPDGIVSHVYPLEKNEKVIGLNYFSEGAGNQEAVAAKESGQLVLGGPFDLIQGGQALVGRYPVYLGEHTEANFWGLVSVTLNYPQALEGAALEQLQSQGYAYEIWRISPETGQKQIIASSCYDYSKNAPFIEYPMQILNANWYFRLSPVRSWYQYPETWILSFAGLVISLLTASLVAHNQDLRQMKAELEDLTYHDALTRVLNRRGAYKALERLMTDSIQPFVLCYLDLNHFKKINDTYGHSTGDKMLQHFVNVVQRHLDDSHIFARIGGDEFLLVCTGHANKKETILFLERLYIDLQEKVVFAGGESGELSFSAGMAVYPADGDNIDDLILLADKAMYDDKGRVL